MLVRPAARMAACILMTCALLAPLAAPPAAPAASAKTALKSRFDSAAGKLKAGKFTAFCKMFTRAGLKRLGGVSACAKGLKGQDSGGRLRRAARSLTALSVVTKGSGGVVAWRAAGRNDVSRWRKVGGVWRLNVFFGG